MNEKRGRKMIKTISEFFPKTIGNEKGKCIICGRITDKGHEVSFSDNFTSWNILEEGEVICEYCYTLVKNQEYRRKSWLATKAGIRYINREEILNLLQNPPNPPFAIYLTKTGKKQGFLKLINYPAYSKTQYFIAFDDNLILVDTKKLEEMRKIAEEGRKLKFSKTELLGNIKVKHYEHHKLCEKILKYAKQPLWEVVVYAIK